MNMLSIAWKHFSPGGRVSQTCDATLHQFLPAETVQVSEEWILFIFLGSFFLSHYGTVLDL
jgi:hypothetical protein